MTSEFTSSLPTEVRQYAIETLHETKENRKRGMQAIKSFASKNPHLHIRTEDKYILPYLRNCKFDIEKTKEKLKNFYKMKRDRTELFENRNPHLPELKELARMGCFVVLKQTYKNQAVILSNPTHQDPKHHTLDDFFKLSIMVADITTLESELAQIYGYLVIVDMKNTSFEFIKQFSISFMRLAIQVMQTYHCRPQKIAFVNVPVFVSVVLNMFKAIMPEKMRKRIHVSNNGGSSLKSLIDVDMLPEDYGGKGESLEELGKYWMEKLISYESWFAEDEKYKAE
ncbi:hypothetical protein WA026_009963 [Henosepilachna vigintioctopunctata]|uniref:CRAL-TRIO domain-containing protein n=1 Tax=Henosepilachna vigintioctopunctata TaxID=420089 RepID=A0AAW1TQR7_9CUCU